MKQPKQMEMWPYEREQLAQRIAEKRKEWAERDAAMEAILHPKPPAFRATDEDLPKELF